MSELDANRMNVLDALSKNTFHIPDYQRPYAWTEVECQTLWDDLRMFAFPNDDTSQFKFEEDEYFLGPIVTYKNGSLSEVIDGQQRLTTILLMLRAFYPRFSKQKDDASQGTLKNIGKCIWKTNEHGTPYFDKIRISSDVALDDERQEFIDILKNGNAPGNMNSKYAVNYRFFEDQIDKFIDEGFLGYLVDFPTRVMNNCILLKIEASSQDTALQVFSTLNNRGLPLSDSDIFKAQLYGHYKEISLDEKNNFIQDWKELEVKSKRIFDTPSLDELFTRYMYYLRAKEGIDNPTTESLRKFYGKDHYQILKNDSVMTDLKDLMSFWEDIDKQDEKFSNDVLKCLFVLNNSPNGMWKHILSAYYLTNRQPDTNDLDQEKFNSFLRIIIGFTFAYAIANPGVNSLRTPVYPELVNIVNGGTPTFSKHKFDEQDLRNKIAVTDFGNGRSVTRSMVAWWAFENENQTLMPTNVDYHIEHIYATKRHEKQPLSDVKILESLGNKALLEYSINIRATDYKFTDKKDIYLGLRTSKKKVHEATKNAELLDFANNKDDFTETDIVTRNKDMIDGFIKYLKGLKLIIE